jgi:hypothetical protein
VCYVSMYKPQAMVLVDRASPYVQVAVNGCIIGIRLRLVELQASSDTKSGSFDTIYAYFDVTHCSFYVLTRQQI